MSTSVKYFNYTMAGAPVCDPVPGNVIGVLDACLVNGFGSKTLDSLVVAGNVATATVSAGHNFPMIVGSNNLTPGIGPVILIEGATPSSLNGEWRIASVPSSSTFTFSTSGISDQTATGTITAKRAPAGFSKVFSGTNLAAYQSNAIDSTRLFLRVDSTAYHPSTVSMYETMSDINTGTGISPTSGSYDLYAASSGNNRPWHLFADDRCFYLWIEFNDYQVGNFFGNLFFGDIVSLLNTDKYHCGLIGSNYLGTLVQTTACSLARSYTQEGERVDLVRYSNYISQQGIGSAGDSFPSKAGNQFIAWPIEAWESNTTMRGIMPGFYNPLNARLTIPQLQLIDGVPNYPNRHFIVLTSNGYGMAYDLTGPWR